MNKLQWQTPNKFSIFKDKFIQKKKEKNCFTLNFLNENQKFNKQYYERKILRYQKKL